jgi:DnaJ-domain-containing protein 1
MASSADGFWLITAVTAVPAGIIALIIERRRIAISPGTLPFAWGAYFGLNAAFVGVTFAFLGITAVFTADPGVALLLLIVGTLYTTSGYFAVRRSRAGLIASTFLSFNILWWIANAIYIRNRWSELKPEKRRSQRSEPGQQSRTSNTERTGSRREGGFNRPAEYAIDCPICNSAPVSDVRTVWFLWGMLLVARYGHRTFVGCQSCVRRESFKSLIISGLAGWWCFPWGLGTPFIIVQNLWETCRPTSPRAVEDTLRKVGMNPDDLKLDALGFTRIQRRLIDITAYVLNSAIWADGVGDPREHARALSILQQISAGKLTPEQAAARLASVRQWEGKLNQLSFEMRQTLLTIALDVVTADGVISLPEMAMLHELAERLEFPPSSVDELLNRSSRNDSAADDRTQGNFFGADISKAATILGVRSDSSLIEIQSAWRQVILRYHPDRAAGDTEKQRDFTHRSQEINWAKDVLTRHASRMAAA